MSPVLDRILKNISGQVIKVGFVAYVPLQRFCSHFEDGIFFTIMSILIEHWPKVSLYCQFQAAIWHTVLDIVQSITAQCPIWHINVTNSFKFTKFLLRWKVDFFNQRGYQGAKEVHYLYFQSSRTRIHEEIVVFLIISRKKSLLAWTGKK